MAWYVVRTGIDAKDMFGEVAYIETELEDLHEMDEDKARKRVGEIHPDMQTGTYIKNISKIDDWDVKSVQYGSKEGFMKDFGSVVGSSSNAAYTLTFGRVSVKEARKTAD